jgi:DNA-binding XRE family transcriptional regulator
MKHTENSRKEVDIKDHFIKRLNKKLAQLHQELPDNYTILLESPRATSEEKEIDNKKGKSSPSLGLQQIIFETKSTQSKAPDENGICVLSFERIDQIEGRHIYKVSLASALSLVKYLTDSLVEKTIEQLDFWMQRLVEIQLHQAILTRKELLNRWPWAEEHPAGALLLLVERQFQQETKWPGKSAPVKVALWARKVLNKLVAPKFGDEQAKKAEKGLPDSLTWQKPDGEIITVPWNGLALLYMAEQEVINDLKKPAIAIDSNKPHHDMVMAWRDWEPKDIRNKLEAMVEEGRVALLEQGKPVQLTFPYQGTTPHESVIHALRKLRSHEGLRHWAALLRMFAVEGGRQGWVRWTLDEHFEALGYGERKRLDPETRASIAHQVEQLTELELAVYNADGTLRAQAPILTVGLKFDRLEGSEWRLDGMQLQINELLYQGVRKENGEVGKNWFPAPIELARIDHVKYRYAITLGLILPIRWRLAWAKGEGQTSLSGANLLKLAGITRQKHRPGRAWEALKRDVEELKRIGLIGRIEWKGEPWTERAICHLYPANWLADRTIRSLKPIEAFPAEPPPLTGHELREWRKKQGLTQAKAAEKLGVGSITIKRTESSPTKKLGPKLQKALKNQPKSDSEAKTPKVIREEW